MDVKNNIKSAPVSCESIHISLRHFCLNRLMYHSQRLDRLLGDRPTVAGEDGLQSFYASVFPGQF
jgi:hypothetical protein